MPGNIKDIGRELRDAVMDMQPSSQQSQPSIMPLNQHPMALRPGPRYYHDIPDNQTMFQGFEWYVPADHKHWNRLARAIPGLAALGITSMWIPPACKSGWVNTNGYDIYDLYDLGEFDQKGGKHTKWGMKEELVAMTQTANAHRVKILFDAVLNHKAAADFSEEVIATKVDSKDRKKTVSESELISAWTGYDFHGRGNTYSPLKWNKSHFTGIDYNDKTKSRGVWKFEGREWAHDVDEELGNYDYLMFADVDHKHPEVRQDIFHWVQWLASQLKLGGLRLDAIKHYSAEFLRDMLTHIDRTVGKDWFIVGEYWREDLTVLASYIEFMNHRISLFDVRLLNNFSRMSFQKRADLRTVFDGTLASIKPANVVTFIANHDTMQGQSLEAPIATFFVPLAYALILLRNDTGLPCVFYGDLYGHPSPDKSKFNSPPFGSTILPKLIMARKLFAYGHQTDYFSEAHCIGFTRSGEPAAGPRSSKSAGLAVVMNNGQEFAMKRMYVGRQHPSTRWWTDILKGCWGRVLIDDDGWGLFPAGPMSVSVWVNELARGRDMLDGLLFDTDIYEHGIKDQVVTADQLYQPRLQTTPAWMGVATE